jgi:membrane protein implicated in regulation of membrane protease activity
MQASTLWWIATGLLVAAELATGTFYLLMLAVGLVGGALAAHMGANSNAQIVMAAVIGGGAVALLHLVRRRQPRGPAVAANPDVNIDIGERVQVPQWTADGTARVSYRGSLWSVRFHGEGAPEPGEHIIRELDGSELLLERRPAAPH